MNAPAPPRSAKPRRYLPRRRQRLAELLVLTSFVFSQPLLDLLGRNPDFFVFRRSSRVEIVALALAVALVPAIVLGAIEEVVRRLAGRRMVAIVHTAIVGALAALLLLYVLKQGVGLHSVPLVAVAIVGGAGLAVAYRRVAGVSQWLRYAVPAPALFVALFLFASPTAPLVLPASESAAAEGVRSDTPIVVLFFDEFPIATLIDDGHVNARLFPNFARLAGDATWFPNTTGIAGFTPVAVPAMLSGKLPEKRLAPAVAQYPNNLFTWLSQRYDLHAFETVTALCPVAACDQTSPTTGLPELLADAADVWRQAFSPVDSDRDLTEEYVEATVGEQPSTPSTPTTTAPASPATTSTTLPRTANSASDMQFRFSAIHQNQPARVDQFIDTLRPRRKDARPPLHFLHLLLPHAPFRYLPGGELYPPVPLGSKGAAGVEADGDQVRRLTIQRHFMQAVYTDRVLGQILDRLEAVGMYDDALLVVTADHGRGFTRGLDSRKIAPPNAATLAWVPFFVKPPGQTEGRIDPRNTMTIDLLPTIADLLDIAIPWKVDGRSAVGSAPRPDDDKVFFNDLDAGPIHFRARDYFASVQRGLWPEILPADAGVADVVHFGSHPELVGQRREQIPVAGGLGEVTVEIDQLDAFTHVPDERGRVPAFVTGRVSAASAPSEKFSVAFILNGRVAATSEVFDSRGKPYKFAATLDPRWFVKGANAISVALIVDRDGKPALAPTIAVTP